MKIGAGEMVQLVSAHQASPRTQVQIPSTRVKSQAGDMCNPSTEESEVGGSLGLGDQPA